MTVEANPLVSVAILTWNRRDHLAKAINSVLHQAYRPVEIIVVDSASTDGTDELIRSDYPDVKSIRLHRNLGCPEGRNVALSNCSGEIIYALDDDGWLAEDTLEICVDRFKRYPQAGIVGCAILAPGEDPDLRKPDTWHHVFSGGASAVRRQVLESAGYYPSDFYRQAEEGDLALRIFEQGFEILLCSSAVMFHELSPINRNDKLFVYYNVRNELYTIVRRYPLRYAFPAILQKIITWNYLGLRRWALHYSSAGVVSALSRLPQLLRERDPVSLEAVRKVWNLKRKSRYSAMRGAITLAQNGSDK